MQRNLYGPENGFNLRWNSHRNNWKRFQRNFSSIDKRDESALFKHFLVNHRADIESIGIDSTYRIMFLEQPELNSLDYKESLWIKRLNANISLNKTIYEELIFSAWY